MKIKEAENSIKQIWRNWPNAEEKYDSLFALKFYQWLQQNRSDLLTFRCSGDKYQRISAWVAKWKIDFPQIHN